MRKKTKIDIVNIILVINLIIKYSGQFFFLLKSDEHFRWDRALKRSFTESHFLILKCNLFVSIRVLCVCVFGLCILPAKLIKIVGDE